METLDQTELDQLRADTDPEMFPRLIASFVGEARNRAGRVARAAACRDMAALEHESHTLKSSALTFGAKRLHACMAAVEQACLEDRADDAVALAEPAERLAAAAAEALREMLPRIANIGI